MPDSPAFICVLPETLNADGRNNVTNPGKSLTGSLVNQASVGVDMENDIVMLFKYIKNPWVKQRLTP